MDGIVLLIVNRICRFHASVFRLLAAITFGAIWSVVAVVYRTRIQGMVDIGTYIIISFGMVRICAKGKGLKEIIQGVAALFAVTLSLGGAIYVLYHQVVGWFIWCIVVREKEMALLVICAIVIIGVLYRQLLWIREYAHCACNLYCVIGEEHIHVNGFIDSGNILSDPYYKKPVSIVQKQYFEQILQQDAQKEKLKYHIIPFHSLGCSQGILEVIIVDSLCIQCGRRQRVIEGACIGLTSQELSSDQMYKALIPAAYAPVKMVG